MYRVLLSVTCMAVSLVSFTGLSFTAMAEDGENPVIEAHDAFVKDLSEINTRHFNVLFSNHNLVKVVEGVRESVGSAVKACGEKNADIKAPLETRFSTWEGAVTPILEEAEAHINNMIIAQSYAKPKAIKKVLKLIDTTRKDKEKEANKVPVTSAEACEFLLKQMDKTQDGMVGLLRSTLISLPGKIQIEKEEAEAAMAAEKAAEDAAKSEAEADAVKADDAP